MIIQYIIDDNGYSKQLYYNKFHILLLLHNDYSLNQMARSTSVSVEAEPGDTGPERGQVGQATLARAAAPVLYHVPQ